MDLSGFEWFNLVGIGHAVRNKEQTNHRGCSYEGLVDGSFMFALRRQKNWILALICRR